MTTRYLLLLIADLSILLSTQSDSLPSPTVFLKYIDKVSSKAEQIAQKLDRHSAKALALKINCIICVSVTGNLDPQIGRFVQIDPLSSQYVSNSTYAYAENDVIRAIDLEGLEKLIITNEKVRGTVSRVTAERIVRNGQRLDNNIKLKDDNGNIINMDKDVLRLQNDVRVNGSVKMEALVDGVSRGENYIINQGIKEQKIVGTSDVSFNQIDIKDNNGHVVGSGDSFSQVGDKYARSEGYVSGLTISVGDKLNAEATVIGQVGELQAVVGDHKLAKNFSISLMGGKGSSKYLNSIKETLQKIYKDATISVIENKDFVPVGNNTLNFNSTIHAIEQ